MLKYIVKRDGSIEDFIPAKLNHWAEWASQDLNDRVDWSSAVLHAVRIPKLQISSQELQQELINYCIDRNTWSYSIMAGRLYMAEYRKALYGSTIPTIQSLHQDLVTLGLMIDLGYTDEEYRIIETYIDHTRDFNAPYFSIQQIRHKYALTNRVTKAEYETPQFTYMRMAMHLANNETGNAKLVDVKYYYDFLSLNKINAPTPNFNNLGTPNNGYASCCIYKVGDNRRSLAAGDHIAYTMTYMSAGIGNIIDTRTLKDPIRGGAIVHGGKLPYYQALAKATMANKQGGRGGACTTYFTCFDPEVKTIIMLQNPKSTTAKSNRDIHFNFEYHPFIVYKAYKGEDVFTFTSFTAPDLFELFFTGTFEEFRDLYERYEADPTFNKDYVSARDILVLAGDQSHAVSTLYDFNPSEANRHTPFKETIYTSNLCVAPETLILTCRGHEVISSLNNQTTLVWNGNEFSPATIRQTNVSSSLITVVTDSGLELTCTPYHKFIVQDDYGDKPYEKRAGDLLPGDRLGKFKLPVISGTLELTSAYQNGFYSGDGCKISTNRQLIYLYHQKRDLRDLFSDALNLRDDAERKRILVYYSGLMPKYFVPDASFSVKSRLEWLAGYCDADGCIYRNELNQQLVVTSINKQFLKEIQLMLQTLGVFSKIKLAKGSGMVSLPVNDGTGNMKDYFCQDAFRLIIPSNELQFLMTLGMKFYRLKVLSHTSQRSATKFVVVKEVVDTGRIDATYCFHEPKLQQGVFNGLLTKNCAEIALPTKEYQHITDLYSSTYIGDIEFKIQGADAIYRLPCHARVMLKRNEYKDAVDLQVGDQISLYLDNHQTGGFREFFDYRTKNRDTPMVIESIISCTPQPEVALCSLGGIIEANVESDDEYELVAYYTLKMIDRCIHLSHYELPHIGFTAKNRLSAGVGLLGIAYSLAKRNLKFNTPEGLAYVDQIAERHAYFLIKASLKLGKELGNAPWMHKTKWVDGWLPKDTYKRSVDDIVPYMERYDWEALRAEIIANKGIRNSVLIAHMPTESSSKAAGGISNGVYPVRRLELAKTDGSNKIDWIAKDSDSIGHQYQLAWDLTFEEQARYYAVLQKYTDQSISADFYRDRRMDDRIYDYEILHEFAMMTRYGIKAKYYQNSLTNKKNTEEDLTPSSVIITDLEPIIDTASEERGCDSGSCTL